MNRRSFLQLLGLAPLAPKLVHALDDEDDYVDPATCFHLNTYRVERYNTAEDAFTVSDSEWIVSGALLVEGEYCHDCGTRLGD